MESENENLINDLNINSLKRGKGRPFGRVGPYKPRLNKLLNNNLNIKSPELNLELNEIEPKPEVEPKQESKEALNLDDLKNKDYVFQLPQTTKSLTKPESKSSYRFNADDMFDSNMKFKGVQSFSTDYTSLEDDKERDNLITKLKKIKLILKS